MQRDTVSNPENHVQLERILPDNHALHRAERERNAPLSTKVQTVPATPENIAAWESGVARIEAAQEGHEGYIAPEGHGQGRSLRRILQSQGRTHL